MEFLDEFENKPRFLFQSKHLPQPNPNGDDATNPSSFLTSLHKPTLLISLSISLAIFILLFLYFNFEPYKSLLLWLSFSLLIGPLSPPHLTAGDIRVGLGPPLKEVPAAEIPTESNEKLSRKSLRSLKKTTPDVYLQKSTATIDDGDFAGKNQSGRSNRVSNDKKSEEGEEEECEWSEIDEELLRKLMVKHPVGMPGRWEAIAEGFKGKHKVETVITNAKQMGVRKMTDQGSYERFLKSRKPMDTRVVLDEGGNEINGEIGILNQNESEWSSAEDLALLNALKAFPKDVGMRWEKIAASVPGKTKPECMKRVTGLKKGFRSSKASSGQVS